MYDSKMYNFDHLKMTLRYSHLSCDYKNRAVKVLDQLNGTNMAQPEPSQTLSAAFSNS